MDRAGGGNGVLLERDAELAAIDQGVAAARDGTGRFLLIDGVAGIGKTALVATAGIRAAEAGMTVLRARATELERDFPFGVVRQLFETAIAGLSEGDRAEVLSGAADLAAPIVANAPASGASEDPAFSTLHGLYWLCANLVDRNPLALLIDDAHWIDSASARWLLFLGPRLAELPLLLMVTARSAEPGADPGVIAPLYEEPATVLRPQPLSRDATAEVVRFAVAADAAGPFCDACYTATAGNPFLLRELTVRIGSDELTPTEANAQRVLELGASAVGRAVLARVARLGDAALMLTRVLAVRGDGVDLAELSALAGIPEHESEALADELGRAAIVDLDRPLRFAHPVLRTSIYEQIEPFERAALHGHVADRLLTEGADPDLVAVHLSSTEPQGRPDAAELLRVAAQRALARGAPAAATQYLRRAVRERPPTAERARLLLELGAAEIRAQQPDAEGHLREAFELTEDPGERAIAALAYGEALFHSNQMPRMVDVLVEAAEALEEESPLRLSIEGQLGMAGWVHFDAYTRVVPRLARFQDLDETRPGGRLVQAVIAHQRCHLGEPAEPLVAMAERALAGGRLLEEVAENSGIFQMATLVLMYADRLDAAERYLRGALAQARRQGSLMRVSLVCGFLADVAFRRGDVATAESEARASLEAGQTHVSAGLMTLQFRGFLLSSLSARGEFDAALAVAGTAPSPLPDALWVVRNYYFHRGRMHLARGDLENAIADLRLAGESLEAWRTHNPAVAHWRSELAIALMQAGEQEEARRLAAEELALARRFGAARAIGIALRGSGLAENSAAGLDQLREAVAVLDGSPARLEHARALVDLGAALRRAGQRTDARESLTAGMDRAERCGATALVEQARDELVAAGARPRRTRASGLDALTASERRVARMAAEGLTNREIAQALFVTVKTVELHLHNAYRKLGIGSRAQLPSALRGKDPDAGRP